MAMRPSDHVVVNARFQGLPQIALGGYVGGLLAGELTSAEAVFRRPVPLGRSLRVENLGEEKASLLDGQELLATVLPARVDLAVPTTPTLEESETARQAYPGFHRHLFPNCFTCGPARTEEDGLRVFAGPVLGRDLVACPWTPNRDLDLGSGGVAPRYIWSALDCPSIWAVVMHEPLESKERAVSARLAVQLRAPVVPLEPHVVVAWSIGQEGRTRTGAAAIVTANGKTCAVARHMLMATDWGVPLSLAGWK